MAFIENEDIKIEGNLFLGSTIKFTSLFSSAPESVSITIEDPATANQVDEVAMTVVADTDSRVWEYTYQSEETDYAGLYYVYIKATSGLHLSLTGDGFELIDADDRLNGVL